MRKENKLSGYMVLERLFPYMQRTYHRKGQRCIVKHGPLRGGIQSISMVTTSGKLYFMLRQGSFTGSDVVDFLATVLKRFRRKKLMIIWDGVAIHRSKEVKEFLRTKARGRIHLAQLPPYSPQLNADEQVHSMIYSNASGLSTSAALRLRLFRLSLSTAQCGALSASIKPRAFKP